MDYRAEVQSFIADNCPESIRDPNQQATREDWQKWSQLYFEQGWSAPTWPTKYGGGGLDKPEIAVLQDELRKNRAVVGVGGMGLTMIGPALLEFGTEEQCLQHLPRIVR